LGPLQPCLRLCGGGTAQLRSLCALAADGGITHGTARAWLSVLEASFVAFRLPPFHSNVSKRLVKTPKLHFYDTGLVSYLLGIRSPDELRAHPLRGPIFESWVASEVVKARVHRGLPPNLFFFRDRKGAELDRPRVRRAARRRRDEVGPDRGRGLLRRLHPVRPVGRRRPPGSPP